MTPRVLTATNRGGLSMHEFHGDWNYTVAPRANEDG